MQLSCGYSVVAGIFVVAFWWPPAAVADTLYTWNGGTGNWSTRSNWTPATVPGQAGSNEDVRINTGSDDVTMDFMPVIGSFTLGGTTASSILAGPYAGAPLVVNHDMSIGASGSVGFQQNYFINPFMGAISVGGNLNNAGNFYSQGNLIVSGNMTNTSGNSANLLGVTLSTDPYAAPAVFKVGGTLLNQGNLFLGAPIGCCVRTGPTTTVGTLVNQGSLAIGGGTLVTLTRQPGGIIDILPGSSWQVYGTVNAGSQNAFAHLTSNSGALTLENGITTTITPNGGTLSSSQMVLGDSGVSVVGNFSSGICLSATAAIRHTLSCPVP